MTDEEEIIDGVLAPSVGERDGKMTVHTEVTHTHIDTCEYRKFILYLQMLTFSMKVPYSELRRDWLNLPPCTCHITRRIKP